MSDTPTPIILKITRGTYVGPGCPDREARGKAPGHMLVSHEGHAYDGEHPGQVGELVQVEDVQVAALMVKGGCFEYA